MKKTFCLLVILGLSFVGCENKDRIAEEVNKITLDLRVSRFDNTFANASAIDIPNLRIEYPYLFPAPDSIWIAKLQDSLQIELRQEVKTEFADFEKETADIELLFKYIKYYFPKYPLDCAG